MENKLAEPFTNNWAYIKTELNWLDRLLIMAVGKQRRDLKDLEPFTRNPRDRATRHWWKGIISLDQNPGFDDIRPVPVTKEEPNLGYQEQLLARVEASHSQGIVLALPILQKQLQLTLFEKNVVLLSLAPEVNRRYSKLYHYLQEEEKTGGPLVDLALKLFCRNDQEWQAARFRLTTTSPLVTHGLLQFVGNPHQPLLMHILKLSEPLINCLISHQLAEPDIDRLLQVEKGEQSSNDLTARLLTPRTIPRFTPTNPWQHLILPEARLTQLQHLCWQVQKGQVVWQDHDSPDKHRPDKHRPDKHRPDKHRSDTSGSTTHLSDDDRPGKPLVNPFSRNLEYTEHLLSTFDPLNRATHSMGHPGLVALLIGNSGTGKTIAAQIMATVLNCPFYRVDLRQYSPEQFPHVIQELIEQSPRLLLLEPAQEWLGKRSNLPKASLLQFLSQRRAFPSLTLFKTQFQFAIPLRWKTHIDQLVILPNPDVALRLRLWQQILAKATIFPQLIPTDLEVDTAIDLVHLAQRWRLTGGEIVTIVSNAIVSAQMAGQHKLTLEHLQHIWYQHQYR